MPLGALGGVGRAGEEQVGMLERIGFDVQPQLAELGVPDNGVAGLILGHRSSPPVVAGTAAAGRPPGAVPAGCPYRVVLDGACCKVGIDVLSS